MNARTLIPTVCALVALAAPAVASAKLSPAAAYQKSLAAKHSAKHAKQIFKRQGRSREIYTDSAAGLSQQQSLEAIQTGYDLELIDHAIAAIQFPDTTAAPAASDDSSTANTADSTQTPDSTAVGDSDDC